VVGFADELFCMIKGTEASVPQLACRSVYDHPSSVPVYAVMLPPPISPAEMPARYPSLKDLGLLYHPSVQQQASGSFPSGCSPLHLWQNCPPTTAAVVVSTTSPAPTSAPAFVGYKRNSPEHGSPPLKRERTESPLLPRVPKVIPAFNPPIVASRAPIRSEKETETVRLQTAVEVLAGFDAVKWCARAPVSHV